ncbi:unnamed protein product, partial [Vitis vinifera]
MHRSISKTIKRNPPSQIAPTISNHSPISTLPSFVSPNQETYFFWDTPMDYDDNDFQSQNLRLAGEGSAKFPPVLGPYALPKFDFDDSLQGHLRFDSLVETEVFLGIESQEDNQWIEDFSRGSSGIEFSSSAAESCSISRRNNVWSEATSSESVEMLLKSVGQEEIVPGQTTVKDSGACDELGSITKQMEHNLKPDNSNLSNVGNVIDSGPTIRPDEFLGSFSVLNKDAGKELPQIEDTSQTREGDSLAYRSSTDLPVTEGNMLIDSKDDDANQGEIDTLVNESLNNNTQDDFSASGMQVDNIITSMHNVITSAEELNNQKAPPDHINDIKSRGEGNAVETCTSNVEGPSSTIVKSDSELNVVEGCSEGVKESVQESKCEVVLSKDAEMVDQFTVNMHGGSPIASKGESSFSGHAVEVSNRNAENCAILEQKMDSHVQLTYEKSSFVKKKDDLLESGNQLNSEISTSHLDTSLLSEETNKLSEDLNAGDHVPISTPSESIQIRIQNAVSRQSGIHNFDSDVPVVEEGNVKLSTDLSNMEHEIAPGVVLKDTDLASHETLDGSSLPSGLGVSTVDSFVHKEDGKPPSLIVGLTHLDRKEEVADGGSVEVSLSAGIEHSQVGSKTVSASDEKDACCDTAGERPSETIDSSLPMMEISNAVSQNEPQAMITDKDDQESKKLEVCPVLCDSTVKEGDGAEAVLVKISEEATTKEGFDEASLKVTDVEISRKGHMLTPPVPFSLEGSCSDIGQKVQEENGAPSVSGDKRQQTAVSSTGSDALNGHEGSFSAVSVSEHDAKLHVTEGGKNNADSDKPNCGSPTVISCIDLPQSEKESQEGVRSAVGQNVPVPEIIDGVPVKGSSMSQDPKEDDSSKDERSFSFEVGALADLSEREAGKCWQPFSTQACKTSVIVEGSPSTSVLGQMDPKMAQEISRGSPRASGGIASGMDKSGNLSPIPSGATQYVQSKEMQHTGNMERSSTKSCGTLTTPTSNLPDLNTSASPSAIFQQPFTDLQQVQLRAQIFVYGSLIQGTAPDEACMASAFGTPDGGRSLWENAWHASVERLQGQKSHPSNPETPLQSRSGARTPDQASIQQGALQGKVIPSPVGRASSKGTPSTIVNPMMPLPSPLWSISTQGDVMQSSGLPRGGLMDHHPALSPLHPYQTPPVRNFVGHNTSWISQPTFPGPWVPSQTSGLDASVRFPALPVTETVKLTPVRESTVPHSSSVKHVSSGPMGHSGGPTSVFAGTSPLLDAKKATASPGQPSTDPKPRKRKKTPASEGPSQISLPSQSQTEPIPVVTSHFSTSVSITTPASLRLLVKSRRLSYRQRMLLPQLVIVKGYGVRLLLMASILVAAREAARRRVEAASAASKRAENLDAIVKAAELAAEAVSQAGKIVAMGDPLPLSELVEAGPEGYWKASQVLSEPVVRLNNTNRVQADNNVEEGPDKHPKDHTRLVDGMPSSVTSSEKDSRGQKGRKVSDLAKTIGVVPESEVGSRSNSIAVQNEYERTTENLKENSIKEGSLVEVFKDGDGSKAAWFSANVLSLKDQKAYVCYVELPSDEGSGQLKEWVALESEGDKPPRIRFAHPMTAIQFEGTRKRRRAAIGDYAWSVGDRVDVWVQNCWCEGVVTEKSRKDETMLTVRISAQGETSVVRAWHLRPSLIWKDGEWIEWSSSRENDHTVHEGDTPQEKRLKLGSPAVEAKGKDKMSKNIDAVDNEKPEEPGLLALSGNDKIFNVGKNTRDENKPDAPRMIRTGLQKEGSRVIFGVPKPGKKRKFMEVSKHYVADRSNKISEANDSVKFAKYLIPQGSGPRGWKNTSKIDSKEKRAVESKPKVIRSGKPQNVSSRTVPRKDNLLASGTSASNDTNGQAEGPILFSSLPLPSDAPSSKKMPVSNVKSQRVSKGKLAPSGGKLAKIEEEKVYNGNPGKSVPEAVEPRRSNRRIQPTSRLLEGLQSSLIISKIPSVSHDKGHKSQNRSASRGNNHG